MVIMKPGYIYIFYLLIQPIMYIVIFTSRTFIYPPLSLADDSSQVSVSVMLDGEESELFFTCPPNDEVGILHVKNLIVIPVS